jgi:NAD(P)H dehydrogenase (quinone)
MAKVLVLYYSSHGHIEQMAQSVADGVRDGGGEAVVKRVPETVPEEIARKSGFRPDRRHVAQIAAELARSRTELGRPAP